MKGKSPAHGFVYAIAINNDYYYSAMVSQWNRAPMTARFSGIVLIIIQQ